MKEQYPIDVQPICLQRLILNTILEIPHHLLGNCSPPLQSHSKAWELGHMVQAWATMHKDKGG